MTDDDRYDAAAAVRVSSLRATVKKHDNNPEKFRRDKLGGVSNLRVQCVSLHEAVAAANDIIDLTVEKGNGIPDDIKDLIAETGSNLSNDVIDLITEANDYVMRSTRPQTTR
ncbi:hypothetical protein LSAT2_031228, partial [Lamellibrachia satsuma]